jgi:hypothetical protein
MQVKTIDVLRDVRKTLSDSTKWTTGGYARDSGGEQTDACGEIAVSWCGQGAVYASGSARGMPTLQQVMYDDESGSGSDWARPLLDSLDIIAVRFGFDGFIDANDNGGRAEVLRIIDSAIAELEGQGDSCHRSIRSAAAPSLRGRPKVAIESSCAFTRQGPGGRRQHDASGNAARQFSIPPFNQHHC